MEFGLGFYSLGFLAGLLSTLSPCVLPLVPILLGSATTVHRGAPLVLAGGLALSYAVFGTALAWLAVALSLDTDVFRYAGALVLGLLGIVLMSSSLQHRFAIGASSLGQAGNDWLSRAQPDGLWGQFVVGLVLGVVWSPCVGPTLGAAIVLAGQGSHLGQVASLMGIFGIGAALPVVALAYISRGAIARSSGKLIQAGRTGKIVMGIVLVATAAMILSGADKAVETWLVMHTPDWLTELTTRF